MGLSRWLSGSAMQETQDLEWEMATHFSILAWKIS